MSIFNELFERASHDLGIEIFLRDVFILIPTRLKLNQSVCREWYDFIRSRIWEDPTSRNYLKIYFLETRLRSGQFKETIINLNANIVKGVNDCVHIKCDDELALIDVSNIDAAELLLVDIHSQNKNLLKLGGFDLTQGEQLLYDIGHDFFVTSFSHRNKMLFWSKDGKLLTESNVTADNLTYMRTIKVFRNQIFVLSRSNIYVLLKNDDIQVTSFASVSCPESLGTVRSVVNYSTESQFLSGHDREVLVWDLNQHHCHPARSILTDLAVDIARKDNILITVGSLHVPGVNFWHIDTGTKIKTVTLNNTIERNNWNWTDGIFFNVKLKGNHIFFQGNYKLHGVMNFKDYSLIFCQDDHDVEHNDISESKAFFLDTENCNLIINDYWTPE